MKFSIFILLFFLSISTADAQKKKGGKDSTPVVAKENPALALKKKVYRNALALGDLNVAKYAVHEIIAMSPEDTPWKDSLAIIYFQMQGYAPAYQLANNILGKQPDNITMKEVKAGSLNAMGLGKEALKEYEELYPKTQSIDHLYQIANLQYHLKRMGECAETVVAVLQHPDAKTKKTNVFAGETTQSILFAAAATNIQGMLLYSLGKKEEAKAAFTKALELSPEFLLAKGNLEALAKEGAGQ